MLHLIAEYDHNTLEYIQCARKTQNIQVQNQMISTLGTITRHEIIEVSEVFSVLVDETRDLQKKDKSRWYHGTIMEEPFMKVLFILKKLHV